MVIFNIGSYLRLSKTLKTALEPKDEKTCHLRTMMPEEIVEKFANSLEYFEPIDGQPSDTNLTRIWEFVALLLLQILYEKTGAMHNLIGLICPEAAYTTRYGAAFLESTRVGAYDTAIDDDATAVARACTEAAHKANRADCATYEMARRETAQFILSVVEDTWVREIHDKETLYTDFELKASLAHLKAQFTGRHAIDLLVLHNEMQH